MKRASLSTWSLHRLLGPLYRSSPSGPEIPVPGAGDPGNLSLIEVPSMLSRRGIFTVEICHDQIPSLDPAYLQELRAEMNRCGVELYCLLIDDGDITDPSLAGRSRDIAWIQRWIRAGSACGATNVRILPGYASIEAGQEALIDHPVIKDSASELRRLAQYGRELNVQMITENITPLGRHARRICAIIERCEGEVQLCGDFDNFDLPDKYGELQMIMPYATSVHAKGVFSPTGDLNTDDYRRCLQITRESGFDGPYSLVADAPGNAWDNTATLQAELLSFLSI